MKYATKNLKNLLYNDKLITALSIICIAASVIIMHFAYGLYQNYHVLLDEESSDIYELNIDVLKPESVTQQELIACFLDIPENTAQAITVCVAFPSLAVDTKDADAMEQENGGSVYSPVTCYFSVEDNAIKSSKYFKKQHEHQGTLSGEYFSDNDFEKKAKVALMDQSKFRAQFATDASAVRRAQYNKEQMWHDDPNAPMGYDISIQGELYQVIGSIDVSSSAIVPITALQSDTVFRSPIILSFGDETKLKPMTRSQYTDVCDTFQRRFGDAIKVPELDIPDLDLQYFYKTILLISVLIALIAAFNFSQLYLYILEKRRKRIAIMRICGATKLRVACTYLLECMMLMLPVYLCAFLCFKHIILPAFRDTFPYMEPSYSTRIYLILLVIYLMISVLALVVMIVRYLSGNHLMRQQKGGK